MSDIEVTLVKEGDGDSAKILLKDFLPAFRKGYLRVGPEKTILTDSYTRFAERLRNLEVRDDDTWVLSFPKTGTTWAQEMVWCIANDLDFARAQENLTERFPFLEVSTMAHFADYPGMPPLLLDSVQFVNQLESPRFIKTHLPWSLLPLQLSNGAKKPKIIYITRNPLDTCVSYYHHCRILEGYIGTFDDFCQLFLGDSLVFCPYWSHVLSGWQHRNQDNVLFLKFEDMKKDLPSIIRQTAKFLGKVLTDEQVSVLAQHLSFDSMKNNQAVNYEDSKIGAGAMLGTTAEGHFMRSGQNGEGKKTMDSEIRRKFEEWTRKNLQGTDFPLED